eukprot:TRINITY_DN3354_c0_g3_i4.p1 TRINITY_DN3354_c0_g3~~TRINITY_DN3354_c0_g3_i4.p1  ORF type:complete len:210 (+),score=7.48 TRINITY_DN3354_c0_g3_i4:37-666(+)
MPLQKFVTKIYQQSPQSRVRNAGYYTNILPQEPYVIVAHHRAQTQTRGYQKLLSAHNGLLLQISRSGLKAAGFQSCLRPQTLLLRREQNFLNSPLHILGCFKPVDIIALTVYAAFYCVHSFFSFPSGKHYSPSILPLQGMRPFGPNKTLIKFQSRDLNYSDWAGVSNPLHTMLYLNNDGCAVIVQIFLLRTHKPRCFGSVLTATSQIAQ